MCLSNRAALCLPTVSVLVTTVLCPGVACLVIRVGADGGRAVTSACDLSIVDGLGGLDVSVKGAQEGGASRGWVKQ